MGMFDYIRCEVPLPDGWAGGDLQTKDFDCEMVTHVITASGRLMLDRGHYEEVTKEQRPFPNEDGMLGFAGSIRRVPRMVDANFHGFVYFGTIETIGHNPPDERGYQHPIYKDHDYKAKFTDGQLVAIYIDDNAD